MASLNKVQLIGHLGKDPEIRSTQSGGKIASFSLATSETWKDRTSGERREKVEWHRIVIFNEQTANFAGDYLKKGHQVYVEGSLQTRKWQDQGGNDRYSTEIVIGQFNGEVKVLGKPNGGSSEERPSRNGSGTDRSTGAANHGWEGSGADLDDEIPF